MLYTDYMVPFLRTVHLVRWLMVFPCCIYIIWFLFMRMVRLVPWLMVFPCRI